MFFSDNKSAKHTAFEVQVLSGTNSWLQSARASSGVADNSRCESTTTIAASTDWKVFNGRSELTRNAQ